MPDRVVEWAVAVGVLVGFSGCPVGCGRSSYDRSG